MRIIKTKKVISVFIALCLPLRLKLLFICASFGSFVSGFVFLWLIRCFCVFSDSLWFSCFWVFVLFKYISTIVPCSKLVKWLVLNSFLSPCFYVLVIFVLVLCFFHVFVFFLSFFAIQNIIQRQCRALDQ